jgi:hypothetical protein
MTDPLSHNTDLDPHQQFQLASLKFQIASFERTDLEELFLKCWALSTRRQNLIKQLILSDWKFTEIESQKMAEEVLEE